MALSRSILKGYFVTGAKPTESQFAALIDNLVHQDDIAALTLNFEQTNSSNFSRGMAAKSTLEAVAIYVTVDTTISIGTTVAGIEIVDNIFIAANTSEFIRVDKFFYNAATLYFTGVTASMYTKFFQRT